MPDLSTRVTIRDVAREAGISVATASHALNGHRDMVSERTRDHVLATARGLGYRPSRRGRQLRRGSSMTLAVQIDSSVAGSNSWRSSFVLNLLQVRGITTAATERGYQVHLITTEPGEDFVGLEQQVLKENAVEGVIFLGYRNRVATERLLPGLLAGMRRCGIASVTIDEGLGAMGVPTVAIDLEPAVHQAAARLAALGHRRGAYIGQGLDQQGVHERQPRARLFHQAFADAGMALPDSLKRDAELELDAYRFTTEMLTGGTVPTCIVYSSDHLAMAGMQAILDRGLRVPEDVSVLGVDHAPYNTHAPVGLATIDQRYTERGRRLTERLLDELAPAKDDLPERIELDAAFIDGPSLGPAQHHHAPHRLPSGLT